MRSIARIVLGVVTAAFGAACSDGPLPAPGTLERPVTFQVPQVAQAPSPSAPDVYWVRKAATVTSAQSGSAVTTLAISNAFVMVNDVKGAIRPTYLYAPGFRITETSGVSGASFSTIRISTPGAENGLADAAPVRVEAGGVSDAVNGLPLVDDEYAPDVHTDSPVSFIIVTLTFVDDHGTSGTLTARLEFN